MVSAERQECLPWKSAFSVLVLPLLFSTRGSGHKRHTWNGPRCGWRIGRSHIGLTVICDSPMTEPSGYWACLPIFLWDQFHFPERTKPQGLMNQKVPDVHHFGKCSLESNLSLGFSPQLLAYQRGVESPV